MYNVLGEICVFILSGIMLLNLFMSFSIYDHIHRLFLFCTLSVFLSTLTNIVSINCITNFGKYPIGLCTAITTVYFLLLGLIPYVFTLYGYNFASVHHKHKIYIYAILTFPFIVYVLFVLVNIKTGLLFYYDPVAGYTRGDFKNITYGMSFIYAFSMIAIVIFNRKNLAPRVVFVFILYPIVTFLITAVQYFTTYFVMTGISSFAPLLLIYLTVQADLIEYDINTNLLTERFLVHTLEKDYRGFFAVISVDNYNNIQESLGVDNTNALIFNFSKKLAELFPKQAFHLSTNRFAVISNDVEKIKDGVPILHEVIDRIKLENESYCAVNLHIVALYLPENANSYHSAMDVVNRMLVRISDKDSDYFEVCTDTYVSQIEREKSVLKVLKRELRIDSDMFQIYLQPIYSVETGKLLYAEVLSRLLDTEIGDIPPYEFVHVAEKYGLIENLGMVAFEKVCQFLSEYSDSVQAVSINFSVHQMKSPTIVDDVLAMIKRYNLVPSSIIIEMTESIFIDDFAVIRERMIELAKNGFLFYLDDFGTGYSNFANIVELPFSTIKFDRSMLLAMEKTTEGLQLLNSLIDAFKDNHLNVLIEGVENAAQHELVKQSGADYVQGFLFSEPLSKKEFLRISKQSQ